ncbi:MAG: hypothetical protein DDT37_01632 [Firmicutes bacterium]|nr:hypothetical protein [candidate division NPL-UPA2 bacterium]
MPAVTNTIQHMSTALAEQCQQSTAIRFAVSFVRESGVKTLLEPLGFSRVLFVARRCAVCIAPVAWRRRPHQ